MDKPSLRLKKRSKKSSGAVVASENLDYPTLRKSPHWLALVGIIQPLFRDPFLSLPPLDLMEVQKRITLLQADKQIRDKLQFLFQEEIKRFFVAIREGFKNLSAGTDFLLRVAKIWKYLHTVSIPCISALFVPFESKVPLHKIILNTFRDVLLLKIDLMKCLAETRLEIRVSEFPDRSMIPDEISHMLLVLQMEVDFYPELQEMLRLALDDKYEPIWPPLTITEEPLNLSDEFTFSATSPL